MNRLFIKIISLCALLAILSGAVCSCFVNIENGGGFGPGEQGGSGDGSGEGPGGGSGDNSGGGSSEQDFVGDDDSDDAPLFDDAALDRDPYANISKEEFYENYTPSTSYMDSYYRTQHGLLSGMLQTPTPAPTVSEYRPENGGKLVRNTDMIYLNGGNTYVVCDAWGNEVFRVHKGGAYITLEEVAAYMFAFGGSSSSLPANYSPNKKTSPTTSIWEEHLRVNHTSFSGDSSKYPKEPSLPNIRGNGGSLSYYEMDIGTHTYNNGNKITRGACRIVYGRYDLNRNGKYESGELHLFYTYNHYEDFQEYLNYYNGWGDIFGWDSREAGSSKPSPYKKTAYYGMADYTYGGQIALSIVVFYEDKRYA